MNAASQTYEVPKSYKTCRALFLIAKCLFEYLIKNFATSLYTPKTNLASLSTCNYAISRAVEPQCFVSVLNGKCTKSKDSVINSGNLAFMFSVRFCK